MLLQKLEALLHRNMGFSARINACSKGMCEHGLENPSNEVAHRVK